MQGDLHVSAAQRIASRQPPKAFRASFRTSGKSFSTTMNQQRALVMAGAFARARPGGRPDHRRLAQERIELLRSLELQRLSTLEWATAERREAIAECTANWPGRWTRCAASASTVADERASCGRCGSAARRGVPHRRRGARAACRSRLRPCLAAAVESGSRTRDLIPLIRRIPDPDAFTCDGSQEVQQILLLCFRQIAEPADHHVGFGAKTLMPANRSNQISGSAVMQKEDPLSQPPQGGGAEFARASLLVLADAVSSIRHPCREGGDRNTG